MNVLSFLPSLFCSQFTFLLRSIGLAVSSITSSVGSTEHCDGRHLLTYTCICVAITIFSGSNNYKHTNMYKDILRYTDLSMVRHTFHCQHIHEYLYQLIDDQDTLYQVTSTSSYVISSYIMCHIIQSHDSHMLCSLVQFKDTVDSLHFCFFDNLFLEIFH